MKKKKRQQSNVTLPGGSLGCLTTPQRPPGVDETPPDMLKVAWESGDGTGRVANQGRGPSF